MVRGNTWDAVTAGMIHAGSGQKLYRESGSLAKITTMNEQGMVLVLRGPQSNSASCDIGFNGVGVMTPSRRTQNLRPVSRGERSRKHHA